MKNVSFEDWINMRGAETERVYFFKDNALSFENPQALFVHDDGTHTIKSTNGDTTEVDPDWLCFSATTPNSDFTFNVTKATDKAEPAWEEISDVVVSLSYIYGDYEHNIIAPSKKLKKHSGSVKVVDATGIIHYMKPGFDDEVFKTNESAAK